MVEAAEDLAVLYIVVGPPSHSEQRLFFKLKITQREPWEGGA